MADMWFPADVRRILAAVAETMQATAAEGTPDPAYERGFEAALSAVATGFGLSEKRGAYEVQPER